MAAATATALDTLAARKRSQPCFQSGVDFVPYGSGAATTSLPNLRMGGSVGSPTSSPQMSKQGKMGSTWDQRAVSNSRLKSSTSLAAAFNLRQYSLERKHIPQTRPESTSPTITSSLERIDLMGGNGKYRQKLAEKEFERRQAEEEEMRLLEKARAEERKRRKEEQAMRRRRHLEEEERRRNAEQERRRQEQEEQEERLRQQEEQRRLEALEREREELERRPKPCPTCDGDGKCVPCSGKGFFCAMFLAPTVGVETVMDYGRMRQGCEDCGGVAQNITGNLRTGSGMCATCNGVGKIAPPPRKMKASRKISHLVTGHSGRLNDIDSDGDITPILGRRKPSRAGSRLYLGSDD